ncbi:hypothetical protein P7K49_024668, partial [Saguinus oedipus]
GGAGREEKARVERRRHGWETALLTPHLLMPSIPPPTPAPLLAPRIRPRFSGEAQSNTLNTRDHQKLCFAEKHDSAV